MAGQPTNTKYGYLTRDSTGELQEVQESKINSYGSRAVKPEKEYTDTVAVSSDRDKHYLLEAARDQYTLSDPEILIACTKYVGPGNQFATYIDGDGSFTFSGSNTDIPFNIPVVLNDVVSTSDYETFEFEEAGHWLLLYSFAPKVTSGSGNIEVFTDVVIDGTVQTIAQAGGAALNTGGNTEAYLAGAGIFDIDSANTTFKVRASRTDSASANTGVDEGVSSIQAIKLDDDYDYLRLRDSSDQTPSGWSNVTFDTIDEINSDSFTYYYDDNNVILRRAGKYLVIVTLGVEQSRSTRCLHRMRMRVNATLVPGTEITAFLEGSNSARNGVIFCAVLLDADAEDSLVIQHERAVGTGSNLVGDQISMQIVRLPEADVCRVRDDSGTTRQDTDGAIDFDTQDEVDTDTFTHSLVKDPSRIEVNKDGNYLCLLQWSADRTSSSSTSDLCNRFRFRVNGTDVGEGQDSHMYGYCSRFDVGEDLVNGTVEEKGYSLAVVLTDLSDGDYIELYNEELLGNTDTSAFFNEVSVQIVNLDDLLILPAPYTQWQGGAHMDMGVTGTLTGIADAVGTSAMVFDLPIELAGSSGMSVLGSGTLTASGRLASYMGTFLNGGYAKLRMQAFANKPAASSAMTVGVSGTISATGSMQGFSSLLLTDPAGNISEA